VKKGKKQPNPVIIFQRLLYNITLSRLECAKRIKEFSGDPHYFATQIERKSDSIIKPFLAAPPKKRNIESLNKKLREVLSSYIQINVENFDTKGRNIVDILVDDIMTKVNRNIELVKSLKKFTPVNTF